MSVSRRDVLRMSAALGAAACAGDVASEAPPVDASASWPAVPVTKPPWVQPLGPGTFRLRVETREDVALQVALLLGDTVEVRTLDRRVDKVDFSRPDYGREGVIADEAGLHVLHETVIEGLSPGDVVSWTLQVAAAQPLEGAFRVAGGPEGTVIGWLSDTMWPFAADTAGALAAQMPDLILHGGDIQYEDLPFDTWNGFFAAMVPLSSQAPMAIAIGNHEFETETEAEIMFDRLLGTQGVGGGRHFRMDVANVRFLFLDSESTSLSDTTHPQAGWLEAQLDMVEETFDHTVVVFHRPVYTLSKHYSSGIGQEAYIQPLLEAAGVKLVLAGHVHAFEHFVVGGVHHWVDGGGGALLYDPDEDRAIAEEQRPDVVASRVFVSRSYGFTVLRLDDAGRLIVQRYANDMPDTPLDEVVFEP